MVVVYLVITHSLTHTRKQTYLHSIAVVHEANLVTATFQLHVASRKGQP